MTDRVHLSKTWALWSWFSLRGAGLPAHFVARLASRELADASDRFVEADARVEGAREALFEVLRAGYAELDAEGRAAVGRARKRLARRKLPERDDLLGRGQAELSAMTDALASMEEAERAFSGAFERASRQTEATLRELSEDALLREAMTWQNSGVVARVIEPVRRRQIAELLPRDQELVANYLHRYCTKNDTVGFFGPVGWGQLSNTGSAFEAVPGRRLLASRSVAFEQWAIDVLASRLASDPRTRTRIPPRRHAFVRIEGGAAFSPLNGRTELGRAEEELLRRCDGETSAEHLANALVQEAAFPDAGAVYEALERLAERMLVEWTLEFGIVAHPERELRRRISRISDLAAREQALSSLDALEAHRERVSEAGGAPDRLGAELRALEESFTAMTGAGASRLGGATYAARGIVVEDCRRDFHLRIGPGVLNELAPALTLVLQSARWLTHAVARASNATFLRTYEEVANQTQTRRIPFADFWFRSQRAIYGAKGRPIDAAAEELRNRWHAIIAPAEAERRVLRRSADIEPLVAEKFDAPAPGWVGARHHSPDLLLVGASAEAIANGEFMAVLGEIHLATNTLTTNLFVGQHPAPNDLREALARDVPEGRVLLVPSKNSPKIGTIRIGQGVTAPNDAELETGLESSHLARERVLRIAELDLDLVDGKLMVLASGRPPLPVMEVMGPALGDAIVDSMQFVRGSEHTPRVSFDRLVVSRETWRTMPSSLSFAFEKADAARYLGARRWAKESGLPRFVFMRSALEVKPLYVDFDSAVAVRLATRAIRKASEDPGGERPLVFTEMLPDLESLWLRDATGNAYTSEMRFVAVDLATAR